MNKLALHSLVQEGGAVESISKQTGAWSDHVICSIVEFDIRWRVHFSVKK